MRTLATRLTKSLGLAIIAAALLLCAPSAKLWADEALSLRTVLQSQGMDHGVRILETPNEELDPTAVTTGRYDDAFKERVGNRTSMGFSKSAWWVRFEVRNDTQQPIDWILSFPWVSTDEIDIYHVYDDRIHQTFYLGDKRPRGGFAPYTLSAAAEISTPANTKSVIYFRMFNRLGDSIETYFNVSSPEGFARKEAIVFLVLTSILGGALILLGYNFILFVSVRRPVYLWYVAYLGSATSAFVVISGYFTMFYPTHRSALSEDLLPILTSLTFIFIVQFSRRLLRTDRHSPAWDSFLRILIFVYASPIPLYYLVDPAFAGAVAMLCGLSLSVLMVIGIQYWIKGHREARIFTIAWALWLIFTGAMMVRVLGWTPSNELTVRMAWIGIILEAMMFAFALGERIHVLRKAKEDAEERERESLRQSNFELERLVAERTKSLQSQHDELARLNRQKDKFFSIIAHDLINPFSLLIGVSDYLRLTARNMPRDKIVEYAKDMNDAANNVFRLLENLLSWSRLQRGDIRPQRNLINVSAVLRETIVLLQPHANEKSLHIALDAPSELMVKLDSRMIETILRNLISNAVKFSNPGDTITVKCKRDRDGVAITVADHGIGMEQSDLTSMLELKGVTTRRGTAGEQGTGLGLQICKDMIELLDGTLSAESEIGVGTTFRVFLPSEPALGKIAS